MGLGSRIPDPGVKKAPDPGSRGQKGTGSRIPDLDPQQLLPTHIFNRVCRISWDLECPQTQSLGSEPVSALLPVPGTSHRMSSFKFFK
jgi:hypothetical protein